MYHISKVHWKEIRSIHGVKVQAWSGNLTTENHSDKIFGSLPNFKLIL